jgi:hypothetical protein
LIHATVKAGPGVVLEASAMFTIRNLGGVALLSFGTAFAWITPEFVTSGLENTGALWSLVRVLALVTAVGFLLATWGLFQRKPWWETTAIASAMLGVVALVPYWVAAHQAGEMTPWFTVLILALGSAGVLVLLLVPRLERWVNSHIMSV